MSGTSLKGWGAALALAVLTGCSGEPTGPEGRRMPGVLTVSGWTGTVPLTANRGAGEMYWDRDLGLADLSAPRPIDAPDTVRAGAAFDVTTYTVGMSGCWRPDGQTVEINHRVVLIKPFDVHSGADVCTDVLLFLAHTSTILLDEPGEWTIRVSGRRVRLGDSKWEEPVTAEKIVIVR